MRLRAVLVCAALVIAAGCSDDGAVTTTTAPTTTTTAGTAAPTTQGTTTMAPTTTAPPATTTTTAATTTTTPADAHPVWGVSWSEFLPPEGASGTYEVVTFDRRTLQLPGRIEYGIEWRGETWDRFVIGTLEVGQDGGAAYLDLSEPWVIRFGGVENTGSDTDFLQSEWFDEPLVFDFNLLPDESITHESVIHGSYGNWEAEFGFAVTVSMISEAEPVEVPAGTYDAAHFTMAVGGEFMGGVMDSDCWMDLHDFFVKWTNPPGFLDAVLAEPWDR